MRKDNLFSKRTQIKSTQEKKEIKLVPVITNSAPQPLKKESLDGPLPKQNQNPPKRISNLS